MPLWASGGPWAAKRLAAVSYVLGSNGATLPIGWDWRARPPEFIAPDPLNRPLPHGLSDPIPTVAEAEKNDKRTMEDLDIHAAPDEPHMNLDTEADARRLNLN